MARQALIEYFIAEAEDHLNLIEKGVLALEKQPEDSSMIEEMFRAAHTLKGSAALVKIDVISRIAHLMEDILEEIKDGKKSTTRELATWMLQGLDTIKRLIRNVREGKKIDGSIYETLKSSLPMGEENGIPLAEVAAEKSDAPVIEKRESGGRKEDIDILESKFVRIDITDVERIMNLMGELTVVKNYLLSRIQGVDDLRDEITFAGNRLLTEVGSFSERYAYSIPDKVKYIDPLLSEFHELEFDRYDELNLFARKLQEITDDINEALKTLSVFFETLSSKIHTMDRLISGTKELVSEVRMVDIGRLFQRFTRAVRDTSLQHGKKVLFVTSGSNTKIDKIIFERLLESLMHILRNAIAHGIETPEERLKKGKPEEGTIHLEARREGDAVIIEINDNGRGMDFEKIKSTAVNKRLIDPDTRLSEEELLQFLFISGFSTADKTDMTSGRGVGLDIVKETIAGINGSIEIGTEKDKGTTFRLKVPLSLIIINVVIFNSGGIEFIIPSTLVQELSEIPFQEITGSEFFLLRDMKIPLKDFNAVFGLKEKTPERTKPVIVVNISGKIYGIIVDGVTGQEDTIIKPFGKFLAGLKHFSGVSISADGKIRPVVNPAAIVDSSAIALGTESLDDLYGEKKETVLIVDDSLSIRKFVGTVLESRNYNVLFAANGLEALNIIDENRVDLIITDLEMPVMHGYELMGELKRRGLLDIIPAIVLTSRSSEKHKDKSLGLGASDFLIKPFEEEKLLETVKRNIQSFHLT